MTDPTSNARVVVSKNGPYLVSGGVPLSRQTIVADKKGESQDWHESDPFPAQEKYALCRCGHSSHKPFCDGTHSKIDFNGTETASREPYKQQAEVMDGPVLGLADAEALCAFARFCDPNGQVWSQVSETDNAEVRETFTRQVHNCPAGRLVAFDEATDAAIEPELPVAIGLVADPVEECAGPLWLTGGIQVVSSDGYEYEVRNRQTLCRCGESSNKPFCDGTHASIKFQDR